MIRRRYLRNKNKINVPTPDCYYDFSKGSNDDVNRNTIKDYSGNGNDAVAHNVAWRGMSGYGGYNCVFVSKTGTNRYEGTFTSNNIHITKFIEQFNRNLANIKVSGNFTINISGLTGDRLVRIGPPNLTVLSLNNGTHRVDGSLLMEEGKNYYIGILGTLGEEETNINIDILPEYKGALVFDGIDDYVSLNAFDSGFKTMFIECSYVSLSTILYDQRKVGTEQEDCINTSTYEAGFYGRNKSGKTYINGVYNKPDSTLIASKLSNKHILITSIFKGDYTSTPCIASSNVNKGAYCNTALYKLLGFKEALTEEQIQAVIKKYNLLDGVDEIEVS